MPPKILKINIYILYMHINISEILFCVILSCGLCYVVISFPSYKFSIYSKIRVGFETQLIETTKFSLTVSK